MSLMAVKVCIYAKDGCTGLYMAFIVVEFKYVIDDCGGLYMAFMAVEVCIWHLWLSSSVYVIDSCGGLYMAFMAV